MNRADLNEISGLGFSWTYFMPLLLPAQSQ